MTENEPWKDEIVEEVRRARTEIAAQCHNNLDEIIEDARKRQEESGAKIVSFVGKKKEPAKTPNQT